MSQPLYQLFDDLEVILSNDSLPILKEMLESDALAELHLYHEFKSNERLAFFYQLVLFTMISQIYGVIAKFLINFGLVACFAVERRIL
jgi:hypothetical protein